MSSVVEGRQPMSNFQRWHSRHS